MSLREITIASVSIDSARRLLVRPSLDADSDFALIYRAAMGVNWDSESRSLVAPTPKEWSHFDWFKHLIEAVSIEYGQRLVLSETTQWANVPEELRAEIERYLQEPAA